MNTPVGALVGQFPELLELAKGDPSWQIKGITSPELAEPHDLVFLATPKAFEAAKTRPGAFVVPKKDQAKALKELVKADVIICSPRVDFTMVRLVQLFCLQTPHRNPMFSGVHRSAVVSPTAQVNASAILGPNVVIGNNVLIGNHTYIGPNCIIEAGSEIGDHVTLHPNVVIGLGSKIGDLCEINSSSVIGKEGFGYVHDGAGNHLRIPHQGRVVLENNVHIGACCAIDRGTFGETRIGEGSRFDNHIHIAHNVTVGPGSLITAGFIVAGSTKIGARFVAGGSTSVTGHINITDDVHLAGLSGVTKSISESGQYGGYPLLPLQQFLKLKVAMTRLPELLALLKKSKSG